MITMKRICMLAGMVAIVGVFGCQATSQDDQAEKVASESQSQVEKVKAVKEEPPAEKAAAQAEKKEPKVENPIVARSVAKDPGPDTEMARIKTNHGDIVVKFFPKEAPLTVANFKGLAAKGYYDGIIFHRVIQNFMIQGGDPTGTGRGGASLWGGKFKDEFDKSLTFDKPGILAMANAGPGTNGSQFFITEVPTPHLHMRHTVFGEVVEGFDVILAIAKVKKGQGDKPIDDVVIQGIEIYTPE